MDHAIYMAFRETSLALNSAVRPVQVHHCLLLEIRVSKKKNKSAAVLNDTKQLRVIVEFCADVSSNVHFHRLKKKQTQYPHFIDTVQSKQILNVA